MENEKKNKKKKIICLFLCAVMLVTGSIAGTLAYLSARTETLTNTFTYGNVAIELHEPETGDQQEYKFKIVPGTNIPKDPTITVSPDGENCYLFAKLSKTAWDNGLSYDFVSGWENVSGAGSDTEQVIYQKVNRSHDSQTYKILANDEIIVDKEIKATENTPTLAITAYAIQDDGNLTPEEAWAIAEQLK